MWSGLRSDSIPRFFAVMGALLTLLTLSPLLGFVAFGVPVATEGLVGTVTGVPFVLLLAVGGYRLSSSSLTAERQVRVANRTLAGGAIFLFVNLVLMVAIPPAGVFVLLGWVGWAVSLGAGTGFLVGFYEARAVQRAVDAQRADIRADELERRRELLDYLNSLLRHEVLNTANLIEGYADLLGRDFDEGSAEAEYVGVIRRQAAELTRVTTDVRILLQATDGERDAVPIALGRVLREELDKLTDRYPAVETELDVPDGTFVMGDELLRRLFSNLFNNAVEHSGRDDPRVTVTAAVEDEAVRVRVADNGPGVPPDERETLFEPATGRHADHGIGLSIVRRLADGYGGRVELAESGPDGSVFAVELPRAERSEGSDASREPTASVTAESVDGFYG